MFKAKIYNFAPCGVGPMQMYTGQLQDKEGGGKWPSTCMILIFYVKWHMVNSKWAVKSSRCIFQYH